MANEKKQKTAKESLKKQTPFDKFLDDQLAREAKNQQRIKIFSEGGETPQQKYNKLYRENPSNRTVWRKK